MDQRIIIIIILLAFLYLILYFVPLGLYFTALFSGVPLKISDLIGMRIRKIPPSIIVNGLIIANKDNIIVDINDLQAFHLAGGNVSNIVNAMVAAKAGGLDLTFQKASQADLAGIDIC